MVLLITHKYVSIHFSQIGANLLDRALDGTLGYDFVYVNSWNTLKNDRPNVRTFKSFWRVKVSKNWWFISSELNIPIKKSKSTFNLYDWTINNSNSHLQRQINERPFRFVSNFHRKIKESELLNVQIFFRAIQGNEFAIKQKPASASFRNPV